MSGFGHDGLIRSMSHLMSPLLTGSTNVFDNPGWTAISPFTQHIEYLNPGSVNNTTFTEFEIPKNGDRLGRCTLLFSVPAITSGTGGDFERLVDYYAYAVINRIEISYNHRNFVPLPQVEMYIRHKTKYNTELRDARDEIVGGGLTAAERDARGTGTQEFFVELNVWWRYAPYNSLKITSLAELLKIRVYWNDFSKFIQSNHTTTSPSISRNTADTRLLVRYYTHTPSHRSDMVEKTRTQKGEIELAERFDVITKTIPNTTSTTSNPYELELKAFKFPVSELRFILRTSNNINGTTQQIDPWNLQQIKRWRLIQNNETIIPWQTHTENIFVRNPEHNPAPPGEPVYGDIMPVTIDASDPLHVYGVLPFSNLFNPTLQIEFNADLTEDWQVDAMVTGKYFFQTIAGDILEPFR